MVSSIIVRVQFYYLAQQEKLVWKIDLNPLIFFFFPEIIALFLLITFIYCENLQRLIPEPINPNKVVIDSHTLSTTLHYISNGSNSLIVTTILLITRLSATVFHNSKRVLFYEIVLNIKARTLWASVIQFPC